MTSPGFHTGARLALSNDAGYPDGCATTTNTHHEVIAAHARRPFGRTVPVVPTKHT